MVMYHIIHLVLMIHFIGGIGSGRRF